MILSTNGNYVEFILPDSATKEYTLTNAYISGDFYGHPQLQTHREIELDGLTMVGMAPTIHYTRSILPDITVYIGQQPSANRAPELTGASSTEATIKLGDTLSFICQSVVYRCGQRCFNLHRFCQRSSCANYKCRL